MYQMKDTERKQLFESMTNLLDEYDYSYTDRAVNKIIDTWLENKSTLIEAFQKHPKYIDGKFMIVFEQDYEREIDLNIIYHFYNWVRDLIFDDEYCNMLPNEIKKKTPSSQRLPTDIFNFLWYDMPYFVTRQIAREQADKINEVFPTIKAHAGEKTTRVMNRIYTYLNCHKHSEYYRRYAKYADALTPITLKRHTVLSINPLDYLTMSFGNSWSSCHTIDKNNKREMPNGYEGQYSSGTMSYMLDGTSMVLYTVDSGYTGNEFYTQPKINRQMFHYGNNKLIQSRLYPQSNDSNPETYTPYRNLVQEIISTIFDFPNIWIKSKDYIEKYTWSEGTHYRDYEHFSSCVLSIRKDSNDGDTIDIGHDPICIECGHYHDVHENINCCRSGERCSHCGDRIDDGDIIWVDGDPYCEDCVRWCEFCEEYHGRDDVQYIRGYGYVCDDCLDEFFTTCDDCGEYIHRDDAQELELSNCYITVCESCADSYTMCDCCGMYFPNNKIHEHDCSYYCNDCYAEIENRENDEDGEGK